MKDLANDAQAAGLLQRAEAAPPLLVFPFRPESAEVLAWAASKSRSWRPRYYLALVHWATGNVDEVRRLLGECGETPDYAPFYAARSEALEAVAAEESIADLERAARLDPEQWRFGRMLAERQLGRRALAAALETAQRYSGRFPDNYILGMLHAKALLANGRYRESASKLAGLRVIPYEGSIEGRRLYREAQLMQAVDAFRKGDPAGALRFVDAARLWPESLGAGKPYPADVDERLEDFLAARCLERRGRKAESGALFLRVTGFAGRGRGAGALVQALALRQAGEDAEGRKLLADWAARDPDSALAAWAARAYAGDVSPLPDGAGEEARVLAAFLARPPA